MSLCISEKVSNTERMNGIPGDPADEFTAYPMPGVSASFMEGNRNLPPA